MKKSKTPDDPLDQRISATIPESLFRQIDDWRRTQPKVPNMSETLRRLIEAGLSSQDRHKPRAARA